MDYPIWAHGFPWHLKGWMLWQLPDLSSEEGDVPTMGLFIYGWCFCDGKTPFFGSGSVGLLWSLPPPSPSMPCAQKFLILLLPRMPPPCHPNPLLCSPTLGNWEVKNRQFAGTRAPSSDDSPAEGLTGMPYLRHVYDTPVATQPSGFSSNTFISAKCFMGYNPLPWLLIVSL